MHVFQKGKTNQPCLGRMANMASAMGLSLSTVTAEGHRAMAGGRRRSKMEPESCCFDLRVSMSSKNNLCRKPRIRI